MKLPPAVIVHGLDDARAVLAVGRPVTFLSAPGAALYAGVGWWRALVAAACQGQVPAPDILDCGAAAGRVLDALRAGQGLLVLHAEPAVFADLAQRAAAQGAMLLAGAPPALDIAAPGAARRLAAWLENAG
jgi:hypothetical protein